MRDLPLLLADVEGVFLHANRPFSSLGPIAAIWFDHAQRQELHDWLQLHAAPWQGSLTAATERMEGFESPFGLELLGTADWLLHAENVAPTVQAVHGALRATHIRQFKLFDRRAIGIALDRLEPAHA